MKYTNLTCHTLNLELFDQKFYRFTLSSTRPTVMIRVLRFSLCCLHRGSKIFFLGDPVGPFVPLLPSTLQDIYGGRGEDDTVGGLECGGSFVYPGWVTTV